MCQEICRFQYMTFIGNSLAGLPLLKREFIDDEGAAGRPVVPAGGLFDAVKLTAASPRQELLQ